MSEAVAATPGSPSGIAAAATAEATPKGGVYNPARKRKVAVLVAFNGGRYHGMQVQPDFNTIEAELEAAMHKAGGISEHNFGGQWQKIGWGRSSRTDKGVHSAGLVVSVKLAIPTDTLEEFTERINSFLPSDIRVLGIQRTLKRFHAQYKCTSREYEYVAPTSVLETDYPSNITPVVYPPKSEDSNQEEEKDAEPPQKRQKVESGEQADAEETPEPEITSEYLRSLKLSDEFIAWSKTYRVSDEKLKHFNDILDAFASEEGKGRNFHNFTIRTQAGESQAIRIVRSMRVAGTFVEGGVQFMRIVIHGQSFMMHQIRKMIAMSLAICRGVVDMSYLHRALSKERLIVPVVPSFGLFLNRCYFQVYNNKLERISNERENVQVDKEPIDKLYNDNKDKIDAFKRDHIYPSACKEELDNHTFAHWVQVNLKYANWGDRALVEARRSKEKAQAEAAEAKTATGTVEA